MDRRQRISPAAAWIVFCVFCNGAGWALSAFHFLNRIGYTAAFLPGAVALVFWMRTTRTALPAFSWRGWKRRFARPFPLAFLILAGLAILGGLLHVPSNYDALAYRTPRVLNWLAEQQWHWIHSDFGRLNTRGCAIEWVTAPLFLFSGTDRFEFIINAICFLLLPGRFFSVLHGLGVSRRTAWYWMWLLPAGYGYLLQSGSIGNDLFGAVCALTAFEFALRARREKNIAPLWISLMAAGLMTASKAFNLVLLLPWAIAVFPSLRLLWRRPLASGLAVLVAAGASLIPTALLNVHYCHDWTGLAAEPVDLRSGAPVLHIGVNAVLLGLHNFAPPVFPFAHAWSDLMQRLVPASISQTVHQYFEPEGAGFQIGEMQMEETSGLGLGLSLLLLGVLIGKLRHRSPTSHPSLSQRLWRYEVLIQLGTWIGLLVFMSRSGLYCPARYLIPFYALLIVPILTGETARRLTYRPGWRKAAFATFLLAGLILILTPPRPLWPAQTVLRALGADQSSHRLVQRAWNVYSVYGNRGDAFQPIVALLPADASVLGLVTSDDPEGSLWHPFGSRRVLHVGRADSPEETRRRGIHYALLSSYVIAHDLHTTIDEWLVRFDAEMISRTNLTLRAARGPTDWFLVRLRP